MTALVLVCGSRSWRDYAAVKDRLSQLPSDSIVMHGAAPGADSYASAAAKHLGLKERPFPAQWRKDGVYNPKAGFIRNAEMIAEKPGLVIAFWDGESRGTKHTIDLALSKGIPVETIAA